MRSLSGMLWALAGILIVIWIVSFLFYHVAGFLIHLLLVVAVIALLFNVFTWGRRRSRSV